MYFEAQLSVILDSLNCWKLMLMNPIYKFPRPLFPVGDFLNFEIEERMFSILDCSFELLPIL